MKFGITLAFNLLLTIGVIAQTYITQARPIDKKEWGYINQKGEFLIPAQYRKCYQFSKEGFAPIEENKKYFFINTKGEKLTTEIDGYKLSGVFGFEIQGFSDGLVPVLVGKKWGYMNSDGKIAIELKYDDATNFDNGFAAVKLGSSYYVIDKKGKEFSVNGAAVVKTFSEGLAPFETVDKKNGFIGTDGKVVIEAQFLSVGYFINGLAWAKTQNKLIGFLNKKGEWAIQPQFLAAKNFDPISKLARVKDANGKWAYVNLAGKIISIEDTETFGDFCEGLAKGTKNAKVGYYNNKGEWAIQPQFEGGRDFKNGFAAVKKDDKWGFINQKGEWVIKAEFAAVKDLELVK